MGSRRSRLWGILGVVALGILALGGGRAWDLLNAVAASNAKVLCSAVFVSGRDLGEARAHSIRIDPPLTRVGLDPEARTVDVSIGGVISRRAVFAGDQGCIALPAGRDALAFTPTPVTSSPNAATTAALGHSGIPSTSARSTRMISVHPTAANSTPIAKCRSVTLVVRRKRVWRTC